MTNSTQVTGERALFTFYDIESTSNVFTLCAYTPLSGDQVDVLEVFYLLDDDELAGRLDQWQLFTTIKKRNPALPEIRATFWDLGRPESNERLAKLVGLSNAEQVNDRVSASDYPARFRPVCDTDPDYDPARHPYLAGYNSMNYDTVMLALYLHEVFPAPQQERFFQPTTAATMRAHSDALFSDAHISFMPGYLGWGTPAATIRRAMLHSGRHLDVSLLNEAQKKVSLKRLLGMLGHQILESDKLGHDSVINGVAELYELLAYNAADCLGLSQLFRHPTYASAFELKKSLLEEYPETRYDSAGQVRSQRLTVDASSAKFVGRILCPDGHLDDIEAVCFDYPAPAMAAQLGIAPTNVLEDCKQFFFDNVTDADAREQFMAVYDYYKSIEGQNFNDSEAYADRWGRLPARSLSEIAKYPNNLPYVDREGRPTSCFATFSTGGIHGAEADRRAVDADLAEYRDAVAMLERARRLFPDPRDFVAEAKRQHAMITLPDGTYVDKRLVLRGSDPAKVTYRKITKNTEPGKAEQIARAQAQLPDPAELLARQRPAGHALFVVLPDGTTLEGKKILAKTTASGAIYRDEPVVRKPSLFVALADGSTRLHPKYTFTSAGAVIHEDFTSYYPNLLRNLQAFYNPRLGQDRYAKIFFDKERYGHELKRPGLDQAERDRLTMLRNGTKLILNAASGAGDTAHPTPIRMNNRIISMRIIGQLFSWRIGQAQTFAGARIISTNTDGLYSVLDEATNNRVLAEQRAAIGVDIEPEPLFLISKDSNNRLELSEVGEHGAIVSASGGTLACHAGPRPDKSLAHPAVIDHALARYLQITVSRGGQQALCDPFDHGLGRELIAAALAGENAVHAAMLFQNVIAASRGSITYPFAAEPVNPPDHDADGERIVRPRALQKENRIFIVRPGTPGAVSLRNAGSWKVNPATRDRRRRGQESVVKTDDVALQILRCHGWARDRHTADQHNLMLLPVDQDVAVRKINSIDPAWSVLIRNEDLHTLGEPELRRLLWSVDLDVYVRLLAETYEKNWKNTSIPGRVTDVTDVTAVTDVATGAQTAEGARDDIAS